MPPPTGIRLRDSCQACAASKTRCSKDKPQCVRCVKRGTTCEYLVTQRTGRKALSQRDSDSKQNNDTTSRRASLKRTVTESSMQSASEAQSSECLESQEAGSGVYMLDSSLKSLEAEILPESTSQNDYFSMLLSDLDFPIMDQPYSTNTTGATPDMPAPSTLLGNISHETIYSGYSHSNLNSVAATNFSCSEEQRRELPLLPDPHSTLFPQTGIPNTASCGELLFQNQLMHTTPQQQGLKMALQLMQHLCGLDDRSTYATGPTPFVPDEQRIGTMIDKSSKVTATINSMLQCNSSQDGYFLAIVCLAMSKVLDAYVAASQALSPMHERRTSRSSSSSSSSISSSPPLRSEPVRKRASGSASPSANQGDPKAVQHLLDELYLVRASMDLLGAKITAMPPSSCDALASALPFSAETLNRLYDEQRRRLKAISLHLINTLKAFWVEEMSY